MQEINADKRRTLDGKVATQRPDEVYGYTILPDGTRHEFVIEGWEAHLPLEGAQQTQYLPLEG